MRKTFLSGAVILTWIFAALLSTLFFLFLIFKIDLPRNIQSVTIVDTASGVQKTVTAAESKRIVKLVDGAVREGGYPACPRSNIRLVFHQDEGAGQECWVTLSADDCATLWREDDSTYTFSEDSNRQLKQIIQNNGFGIRMS